MANLFALLTQKEMEQFPSNELRLGRLRGAKLVQRTPWKEIGWRRRKQVSSGAGEWAVRPHGSLTH